MKKRGKGKDEELRKKAEEILKKKLTESAGSPPKKDILELFYELEVHQIELEMQNEELRRVQQELEESRNRYFELYDLAPVGYFTLANGTIVEMNLTGASMLGIERRSLIKERFSRFVAPDYQDEYYLFNKRVLEKRDKQTCDLKLLKKDGTLFYVNLEGITAEDSKGIKQIRATFADISERKHAEEQVKISLEEKKLLLKEVHHRVKNNMQVISSILSLQSSSLKDEKTVSVFMQCQDRIKSMAIVHEKLYQSENLSEISFQSYANTLVETIFRSYNKEGDKISLKLDVEDIFLDIDTVIPIGLILNELVTNSVKYAFEGQEKGEIKITFREVDKDKLELKIRDNGIGLPDGFDIRNADSLGLKLVFLLAEGQLKGRVDVNRNGGTEFQITFQRAKPKR
jgi:PAS domain S-box-containing protein